MESPDSRTDGSGGPYAEELLLEACNLQWECIDLRYKQLQKTLEHFLLMDIMDEEDRKYEHKLRRLKRQEQEEQRMKREQEESRRLQWKKEWKEKQKLKKKKQMAVSGTQTDDELPVSAHLKKVKAGKPKVSKPQTTRKTKFKRISPTNMPSPRPSDDEDPVSEENENELKGNDSPLPELPDDDLMNLMSHENSSDSDVDVDRSAMSLILPVTQESPKPSPLKKKKVLTSQKRFTKKIGAPPLDFDFTNAEAKRQAQAAKKAIEEQEENNEDEVESEPVPSSPIPTPKKHLKRRKDVAKDRQRQNGIVASGNKMYEASTGSYSLRKKTTGSGTASKGPEMKNKSKDTDVSAEAEGSALLKKKVNGKKEMLSIKQRLANAELLAQMNKMQDLNTPKVLGKKSRKIQKQDSLSVKQKALPSEPVETDVPQSDQTIGERDLSISLNSSGMMSDNESPENLHSSTRKRPREAEKEDGTPTKKLQFLEITKRLVKSPMPKFLRTPTPLASPVKPSAMMTRKAVSPPPRAVNARNTAHDYGVRRMNSAPVRVTKTNDANRFGIPKGGASVVAGGGSFSMFDAFVNSVKNGGIPRLKKRDQG